MVDSEDRASCPRMKEQLGSLSRTVNLSQAWGRSVDAPALEPRGTGGPSLSKWHFLQFHHG